MKVRGIGRLRGIARRVTNAFVPRAIILLYHRVIDLRSDPQLLSVSPKHFAEHLELMRERGRTIQVKALGEALRYENGGRCFLIVSFDDGYADNLYNAKPLLERYDIPATVFVSTGYLGSKREFWYDGLERILLHAGPLPERLRLSVNDRLYRWELGPAIVGHERVHRNSRDWNVCRKDDPTTRHSLYRLLCQILQPLPDGERQKVVDDLAVWAGVDATHRRTHRTLCPEEIIRLADGGLVEIGSHTVSHPMLSQLPLAAQMDEISQSKSRLEEILRHTIKSFAYPFGGSAHYTNETAAAVREAGFEWACSNFAGIVHPGTDHWQLPRFVVRDWDGVQFARALEGWINA